MARDDYFVMVYKLLRYLYRCLKDGQEADWEVLSPNTRDFPIGEKYFAYLLSHLLADGYLEGIAEVKQVGKMPRFNETTGLRITPKGIEYLEENAAVKRAAEFLGPAGDIAGAVVSRFCR